MDAVALVNLLAILVGPIVAVLITRWMDDRSKTYARRYDVFRDLMRTRAAKLSPAHVDALNLVEIEFHRFPNVKLAWQRYMENLFAGTPVDANEQSNFFVRREQLFIKLIQEVANTVGLRSVDITDVMTNNYYPIGWQTEQQEQQQVRQLLIQTLAGTKPLTVKIFDNSSWSGPYPPAVASQRSEPTPQAKRSAPAGS